MCVGRRRTPKSKSTSTSTSTSTPPRDSAIEKTASRVVLSDDRTMGTPKEKKRKQSFDKVTGGRQARAIAPKRLGTRSLQIPLLIDSNAFGNLNYS